MQKSALALGGTAMISLAAFRKQLLGLPNSDTMPLLFVGHGNPMNAILDNDYSRTWRELGRNLPAPKAILSISAHWLTRGGTKVTSTSTPETIHDFGGFPQQLFDQQYPAPGAPDFARQTIELVQKTHIEADQSWGLDHGTWSVLLPMLPEATIPVYQLSIDYSKPPRYHFELARELKKLREKGVLIMGSGNLVHNLRLMANTDQPYDWTVEFDAKMTAAIDERDFDRVVDFQNLGQLATLAHPTYDHFLPLLYTLGVVDEKDEIAYFNDSFDLGSVSMRSLLVKRA